MITANVVSRVYHIKYGKGTGTCFAIDYDNRQYIVTAKHVIENLKDDETVEINFQNDWLKLKIKVIGHHPNADVSVFAIDFLLSNLKLEPTSDGLMYGQDTYFLGFPYMLQDYTNDKLNRNFPFPLVKKATLSGYMKENDVDYMFLDGINNPGFSGGPVVFSKNNQDYKVAGVISGYRYAEEATFIRNEQTELIVRANTGIIIAYDINNAIDLIKKKPIGKEIV